MALLSPDNDVAPVPSFFSTSSGCDGRTVPSRTHASMTLAPPPDLPRSSKPDSVVINNKVSKTSVVAYNNRDVNEVPSKASWKEVYQEALVEAHREISEMRKTVLLSAGVSRRLNEATAKAQFFQKEARREHLALESERGRCASLEKRIQQLQSAQREQQKNYEGQIRMIEEGREKMRATLRLKEVTLNTQISNLQNELSRRRRQQNQYHDQDDGELFRLSRANGALKSQITSLRTIIHDLEHRLQESEQNSYLLRREGRMVKTTCLALQDEAGKASGRARRVTEELREAMKQVEELRQYKSSFQQLWSRFQQLVAFVEGNDRLASHIIMGDAKGTDVKQIRDRETTKQREKGGETIVTDDRPPPPKDIYTIDFNRLLPAGLLVPRAPPLFADIPDINLTSPSSSSFSSSRLTDAQSVTPRRQTSQHLQHQRPQQQEHHKPPQSNLIHRLTRRIPELVPRSPIRAAPRGGIL